MLARARKGHTKLRWSMIYSRFKLKRYLFECHQGAPGLRKSRSPRAEIYHLLFHYPLYHRPLPSLQMDLMLILASKYPLEYRKGSLSSPHCSVNRNARGIRCGDEKIEHAIVEVHNSAIMQHDDNWIGKLGAWPGSRIFERLYPLYHVHSLVVVGYIWVPLSWPRNTRSGIGSLQLDNATWL